MKLFLKRITYGICHWILCANRKLIMIASNKTITSLLLKKQLQHPIRTEVMTVHKRVNPITLTGQVLPRLHHRNKEMLALCECLLDHRPERCSKDRVIL